MLQYMLIGAHADSSYIYMYIFAGSGACFNGAEVDANPSAFGHLRTQGDVGRPGRRRRRRGTGRAPVPIARDASEPETLCGARVLPARGAHGVAGRDAGGARGAAHARCGRAAHAAGAGVGDTGRHSARDRHPHRHVARAVRRNVPVRGLTCPCTSMGARTCRACACAPCRAC
eukprot:351946-Chlamydomonas_euryale.AAC.3